MWKFSMPSLHDQHPGLSVYKIFANGKRAKFPMHSFEHEDNDSVNEYFISSVKTNFTTKQQNYQYMVVRADQPQAREESSISDEELLIKKRAKIFRVHLETLDVDVSLGENIQFGLLFSKETDFKWQWTVTEAGTNQFLAAISPKSVRHSDALSWTDSQI